MFGNFMDHWRKLVTTDMTNGRTSPENETYDICADCWNRIKRENFESKRAEEQHKICQNCGKEIGNPFGYKFGKTLCQKCLDRMDKHKPDKDAIHYR